MSNLSIVTNKFGDASVVNLIGRLDSQSAPELDAVLDDLASQGISKIIANLNELLFISSAGLRSLIKAAKVAQADGGALKLVSVPEVINSAMYTAGLDQIIDSYASVAEAAESF